MKRKANSGPVFKRPKSRFWWIRYTVNGKQYKESTKSASKEVANDFYKQRMAEVTLGRFDAHIPDTTFFQLCGKYWELNGKFQGGNGLEYWKEQWKRYFGDVPCKSITRLQIEEYLTYRMTPQYDRDGNLRQKAVGAATRNRHLAYLAMMFNAGIGWKLVGKNPCKGIKKLDEEARWRWLNHQETQDFISQVEDREFFIVAIHTGMRRSEILRLKPADINQRERYLIVQKTKNNAKRVIPLSRRCYGGLKRAMRGKPDSAHVFNKTIHEIRVQFARVKAAANIEDLRLHDLRHTFACHMRLAGMDLQTLQKIMGHKNIEQTLKYAEIGPSYVELARQSMDQAF